MLICDVDDLEGVGLSHNDANIVIFSVKHYLPVRWKAENAKISRKECCPRQRAGAKLNPFASLSLDEVFATIMSADRHMTDSWARSSDHLRDAARMIDIVYKVAREHHDSFEYVYLPYQLQFTSKFFLKVIGSFRKPFTFGIRPRKNITAEQPRTENLRTNVNRMIHEVYCQYKEGCDSMPSFNNRLEEQFTITQKRAEKHNAEVEEVQQQQTSLQHTKFLHTV